MYKTGYLEDLIFNWDLLTNKVFCKAGMSVLAHSGNENREAVESALHKLISRLAKRFRLFLAPPMPPLEDGEGFEVNTQKEFHLLPNFINYCARSFLAPVFTSTDTAKLQVAEMLLQGEFLHPLIREQGGAYGAFCRYNFDGAITMSTYRDPNILQSFDNFDKAVGQVAEGRFT